MQLLPQESSGALDPAFAGMTTCRCHIFAAGRVRDAAGESVIHEQLLADLILVVHFGIVLFVVVGQILFALGSWRDWRWTRRFALRLTHLALIGYVAAESWLGVDCPLTVWEQRLRVAGGEGYRESFVEHWLAPVLFYDLPARAFVLAYSAFTLWVAATWYWNPPRRR
jgi:hypothetical protein